ncbi:hypothetical protein [uncultured Methanolobus sp.]|uniref:hypothetical protein n=1 Tax=uncultured Methanolobus sp. TaxID=218300 RepID=UPI0029C92F2F|nr:hypothetical protein [uncultured Methanolobus sp.]
MELKSCTEEVNEYLYRVKDAIKNPSYSIFFILVIPFLIALIWVLFDIGMMSKTLGALFFTFSPFLILDIFIVPFIALAYYAYYAGNKLSAAALGLLMYPLMLIYVPPMHAILNFEFEQLGRFFAWSMVFSNIDEFLPFSFVHALMGYLVAFRKKEYCISALLLFIIQAVIFFIIYTNFMWGL